ncbi:MAG: S41 family peptidase [Fimbriimonadaceae bacterium]|nr:S41 family peptidase [Fimbriimonadaceae bacterium]
MKAARVALFSAVLVILFGTGFFAHDVLAGTPPNIAALGRIASPSAAQASVTPVETFQHHFDLILAKHGETTDPEKLRHAAMGGLVASLGDPHTNYLEPKINESFTTETKGNYTGIGARLGEDPLGAKIATVFKGGPADKAGLKPGDVITKVNDFDASGKEVDKIVDKILGEEGTPVTLTLVREGQAGVQSIRIVRRQILIPTVESKMISGNVGYIQVSGFSEPTPMQFREALDEIDRQHPTGLVIDMRGNPGGLLDSAVKMLSLFVSDKPVVTMKERGDKTMTAQTSRGQVMGINYPVTILVNEESASAAEIFAGVMRDYKKAVLIGTHSYGKASVQNLFQLPGGASAKITIAKYFLPATGDISRKVDDDGTYIKGGLAPDIKVEIPTKGDWKFGEPGKDPQLDRAIQYLGGSKQG